MNPDALKRWADALRDWAAVLYTPVLTACQVSLVTVIVRGGYDPAVVVHYLGALAILYALLVGLGAAFLQRRTVNVKATTPGGGSFEAVSSSPPAGGGL